MKKRVMQILLLTGLVSCSKNFDSIDTKTPAIYQPSDFVSSDTLTKNEISADGRTYVTKKYWLTSFSPVSEGSSATIKMNTTNVAKGTIIPFSITGIDTSDIIPGKLTGSFVIGANGTDSVRYVVKADNKTEGNETLKISAMTIALSISIQDASVGSSNVTAASKSFLVEEIPYSDPDFLAPFRGANTFYNSVQKNPIPTDANPFAMDNEKRFTWSELQPTSAGVYNWVNLDAALNSSIDKNQRFSFGIMTTETGSSTATNVSGSLLCYPQYVHDAMQSESVKDWNYGQGYNIWIPNWNSNSYLSAFETFLKAVANHIASGSYKGIPYKNVISKVNLLGFGNWGEWHTWPWRDSGLTPFETKPTEATFKRIIDAHVNSFPDYPLVYVVNGYCCEVTANISYYALTVKNKWGLLGWSDYHLGSVESYYSGYAENNSYSANGVALKNLIIDRWKYAPIGGEPMNSVSEVTFNGTAFGDLERQVRNYHISQFNNNYTPGTTDAINNARAASKACGYRISIKGGSISGHTVTLNWSNSGVAPAYENWDVYLELRKGSSVVWSGLTSFKPKLFLPGTSNVNTTIGSVAAGTYSLYVIVKDPVGYRQPLTLANKNRQNDGSYKMTDINL